MLAPHAARQDLLANCGTQFYIFRADEIFEIYDNHTKLMYMISFLDLTYELILKSSEQTGKNSLPKSYSWYYSCCGPCWCHLFSLVTHLEENSFYEELHV